MNSNKQSMNERQIFDELLADDQFDDSISDRHQMDLRSKSLQAFDRSHSEVAEVELHRRSVDERQLASRKHNLGFAVIVAVCLIAFVAVWFYREDPSKDRTTVQQPPATAVTTDPQLIASLAKVNAFHDEVSREALFDAMAMCELDYEGRMLFGALRP